MTKKPVQQLREMILSGELAAGERLTETGLAERLGMSRTPIRNALPALAAEGFLIPVGKRGFAVKEFNDEETLRSIELRGTLEALAGRTLARNGASPEVLEELSDCLREGDEIFEKRYVTDDDENLYSAMNIRFHRTIVENCQSPMLESFIDRLYHVPFIAPSAIVFDQVGLDRAYELMFRAHGHHHAIANAIRDRDAERVEALFREHSKIQFESMFSTSQKGGVPKD
ncbi:GntR family transcriptional regulator [Emcibacter sp.]|uniref:GntR family transcriptional regulator n=1 Tax=Emcibacter sp. TaxID=1979954 RepID=UPI003A921ED1